jgi:hypothetical protein
VAGETVTVTQKDEATQKEIVGVGTRATYDTVKGTVCVVGKDVALCDGPQIVEGRSLTFHSADGRALVDGLDEARTESVFGRPSILVGVSTCPPKVVLPVAPSPAASPGAPSPAPSAVASPASPASANPSSLPSPTPSPEAAAPPSPAPVHP